MACWGCVEPHQGAPLHHWRSAHTILPANWSCAAAPPDAAPASAAPASDAPTPRAAGSFSTDHQPCSPDALLRHAPAIRLLLGILSSPGVAWRREAIRRTWLSGVAGAVRACFVLGRAAGGEVDDATRREAREHGDIFVGASRDGKVRVSKTFGWLLTAASVAAAPGSALEWVAKLDDDTVLDVRALMTRLDRYRCLRHVCYGTLAFATIDPARPNACRLAWGLRTSARDVRSRLSILRGMRCQPAFPFAHGALLALSSPLLREMAATPGVRRFVRFSDARDDLAANGSVRLGSEAEDHAVGYWLAVTQRERPAAVVAYANAGVDTIYHLPGRTHVACSAERGLLAHGPRRLSRLLAMHPLKTMCAIPYAWELMQAAESSRARAAFTREDHERCMQQLRLDVPVQPSRECASAGDDEAHGGAGG